MQIDLVIAQLRALCPAFNNNVAGAADYANGVEEQVWLPLPAAYVVPMNDDADENTSMTGLQQIVTERIAVILVLNNATSASDRRGQASAEQYGTLRAAVFKALLNWRPDWAANQATNRESRGIYYLGGELLDFDRARLFYRFTFGLDTTITELDGWTPTGTALADVRATITNQTGGGTLTTADVQP